MTDKRKTPKLRLHKPSGRARLRLSGREFYTGPWDFERKRPTPEAQREADRLIALWLSNGRRLPADDGGPELTVEDVLASYVIFAQEHYKASLDSSTGEMAQIRYALRPVRRLFGLIPASKFDAIALKRVQEHLAEQEHHCKKNEAGELIPGSGKRTSRTTISDRVNRIRRCFRWAESEGLVPRGTWDHLRTVAPLAAGRTRASEPKEVEPVEWALVEPTLEHLSGPLRAAVLVGWWAGLRPGETLRLTGRQIDRTVDPWRYVPRQHKGLWRGRARIIRLGPRAQDVLRPFVKLDPDAAIISPRDAIAEQKATKRAARKSKRTPSQQRRDELRAADPKLQVAEFYDAGAFRRAVARACDRAGVEKWHPNQLRHSCAKRLFLEGQHEEARAVLGHTDLSMTRWYAKLADEQLAARAMGEHG